LKFNIVWGFEKSAGVLVVEGAGTEGERKDAWQERQRGEKTLGVERKGVVGPGWG